MYIFFFFFFFFLICEKANFCYLDYVSIAYMNILLKKHNVLLNCCFIYGSWSFDI